MTQREPERSPRRGSDGDSRQRPALVGVRLSPSELALLDGLRGTRSRQDALRAVLAPVTEHAIEMTSGAMQVRSDGPWIERVYPLAQWIPHQQRFGGKVWRRRIIVVDDWEEVPRG